MASIESRSRYQVTVKNRDDLTKTFPHNRSRKAEEYYQSLQAQKLKADCCDGGISPFCN